MLFISSTLYIPELRDVEISNITWMKKFCERLRKENSKELGFIPERAYHDAIIRNRIIIAFKSRGHFENQDGLGFLYFGRVGEIATIYQIAVEKQHRRKGIATDLVSRLAWHSGAMFTTMLKLRCRKNIEPGVELWKRVGMTITDEVDESSQTGSNILHFQMRKIDGRYVNDISHPL